MFLLEGDGKKILCDTGMWDTERASRYHFETVMSETEIVPGIRVFDTPGHSPGHISVEVDTQDGPYILAGDSAFGLFSFEPVPELHYDITPPGRFSVGYIPTRRLGQTTSGTRQSWRVPDVVCPKLCRGVRTAVALHDYDALYVSLSDSNGIGTGMGFVAPSGHDKSVNSIVSSAPAALVLFQSMLHFSKLYIKNII